MCTQQALDKIAHELKTKHCSSVSGVETLLNLFKAYLDQKW